MNTLFTKILLWFIGTAILTLAAFTVVSSLNVETTGRRQPFGRYLLLQLQEARYAYESGGPEALRLTLQRFRSITSAESALTDSRGRDLLTGEDRSDLVWRSASQPRIPFFHRRRSIVARRSPDGQYIYFLMLNQGSWYTWFFEPEVHLPVLAVLLLLCYFFARHLTLPVRQLQRSVDRFGHGDLSARVRSKRSDELGQLARTFDNMADRTQTLLAAERRLLLDISHELRSPLARLSVAVELARSNEDLDKHLNRIQKEADRLNSLVGELLQVTRAEGDVSQLRLEPLPLRDLIEEVIADCRIEAEVRGCTLEERYEDGLVVMGDGELLRRAVENVVRNAIRHSPSSAAVEVSLTKKGEMCEVCVRDYGTGVPDDSLPRIFDPFYRVEPDRNRVTGGVGLGLSIARRAVELHRGRISASNTNPGLLVTIEIPLDRSPQIQAKR